MSSGQIAKLVSIFHVEVVAIVRIANSKSLTTLY